jgi:membrane protein required for colicin V production
MSSAGFNWADLIILGIIALSALISLFRGFVREALSLISWILAFWAAIIFCHPVSDFLTKYIESPTLRLIAAFAGLFFITLIFCTIINFLIGKLVDRTGLSGTDRMLGVVFGIARGLLLVAALLLVAHLTPMPEEEWWKGSLLIPQFEPLEQWLQGFLPKSVNDKFQLTEE